MYFHRIFPATSRGTSPAAAPHHTSPLVGSHHEHHKASSNTLLQRLLSSSIIPSRRKRAALSPCHIQRAGNWEESCPQPQQGPVSGTFPLVPKIWFMTLPFNPRWLTSLLPLCCESLVVHPHLSPLPSSFPSFFPFTSSHHPYSWPILSSSLLPATTCLRYYPYRTILPLASLLLASSNTSRQMLSFQTHPLPIQPLASCLPASRITSPDILSF